MDVSSTGGSGEGEFLVEDLKEGLVNMSSEDQRLVRFEIVFELLEQGMCGYA